MTRIKQVVAVLALAVLTGCATTGRNVQPDIDALNARVSALQSQLSAKDQEMNLLQNQITDERLARQAAETALHGAESEKQRLAAQIESASAKAASTASDLK